LVARVVVKKRSYKAFEFVELERARASGLAFSLTILPRKGEMLLLHEMP